MIKPIPTWYQGIKFRSKLEAKYANALDRLGIKWVYEENNFMFNDGTCYSPDFYLPDIDAFFEVKGYMDDASMHKLKCLANEVSVPFVGEGNGRLGSIASDDMALALQDGKVLYHLPATVVRCAGCGENYFAHLKSESSCPRCGKPFEITDEGPNPETFENVFEAAGWSHA